MQNSESEYSYKQVDEGGESEDKDKIVRWVSFFWEGEKRVYAFS